ncbi:gastrula zinc finger protein XlCGF66.1-like [Ranitomeya variabilis]|uniref:gastrula zinc finger protein XlCGF66.1-like n=1 Tax=Ranitomeya variabilis TaxID=490064 RepID=UPI0040576F5D
MDRDKMAERILHLTLEILFRLTGEDYTVVKKTSSDRCQDPVSEGWGRPLSPITGPPPHTLIHEDINDQKILELAYKMIELLTGEVPIRCQDVAVYFSMEEWEYLEGHKDLYKNVIMEVPQPLTSPGASWLSSLVELNTVDPKSSLWDRNMFVSSEVSFFLLVIAYLLFQPVMMWAWLKSQNVSAKQDQNVCAVADLVS